MRSCCRSAVQYLATAALILGSLAGQRSLAQARTASLKEMTETSHAIFTGTCVKKVSAWNEKRTKIFTQVSIRTGDLIKGNPGTEVLVTVPGGRVGNATYEVSDMPVFTEGEEVLLFLWKHPSGMNLVTGALQGKLTVVQDRATGKKVVQGASFLLESATGQGGQALRKTAQEKPAAAGVTLDDFKASIRQFVKQ
jgi:hypothetical protein